MDLQQHNRFQRIFIDNFFLLNLENTEDSFIFKLSGSTQNVYSVKIMKKYPENMVFCDCQDMKKWCKQYNVFCKHILFIIFRVLQLFTYKNKLSHIEVCDKGMKFLEKKRLNRDYIEIISVFCDLFNFEEASSEIVNTQFTKKYNLLNVNNTENNTDNNTDTKIEESINCIICFDLIDKCKKIKDKHSYSIKCSKCIGEFHTTCLKKWLTFKKSCPYCRQEMILSNISNNYLNLYKPV